MGSEQEYEVLHSRDGGWYEATIVGEFGNPHADFGWSTLFHVGEPGDTTGIGIKTWRGPDGYLLQVSDFGGASPMLLVDTFPEVMDLLARWAPAVQASKLAMMLHFADSDVIEGDGVVERIAAKWVYGADAAHADMTEREQRRKEQARQEREDAERDGKSQATVHRLRDS